MTNVLYWPAPAPELEALARELCPADVQLTFLPRSASETSVLEGLGEADCLFGTPPADVSLAVNVALGRLKLVQLLSAGYDTLDIDAMRGSEVVVCNNGGANAISVAEHTIMMMLAVLRRLTEIDAGLHAGTYKRLGNADLHELCGRTVGLIGFGPVGREVARRLTGFQTHTIYYDVVRAPASVEAQLSASFVEPEQLLTASDIVSLHVPLNDQTRALINRDTLARLRPDAVLINTARGELVDEPALATAVAEGRLLGAGLDVFSVEPPPPDHVLLRAGPRVIATAHNAGPTWESWPRRFANAYANVARVARGEPPQWVIPELR
ncbi:MAG TPA: 2-hydroxyacid dehydrogenase [Chloroflexota bacterium]|nr:2-hydroxyacid dehydrogenase [Chloroflexota bacterium]